MFSENKFTKSGERALIYAKEAALEFGHSVVGTEHILLGISRESGCIAAGVLLGYGVTEEKIYSKIEQIVGFEYSSGSAQVGITPKAAEILEYAYKISGRMRQKTIGTEHILLAILEDGNNIAAQVLKELGVHLGKLSERTAGLCSCTAGGSEPVKTPVLDKFGRDLTQLAAEGRIQEVTGREKEIQRTVQILSRRTKNNPCLIGEPGVGKTAIVEGIACKMAGQELPEMFGGKRLVTLDLSSMVAGTKYRGEFEERLKKVLDEVRTAGNVVLFIDEVHTLIGAGAAEGAIDAANILKPALARGEIQLIGATTVEEYRKNVEKDAALERRFQPVYVEQPTVEETIEILKGLRPGYETHHRIRISDESIAAAARLSARYIQDRFLPDKAIDLLDEAASGLRLRSTKAVTELRRLKQKAAGLENRLDEALCASDFDRAAEYREKLEGCRKKAVRLEEERVKSKKDLPVLTGQDIAQMLSLWTGIPTAQLSDGDEEVLLNLEALLGREIIGQAEAITVLANAIRRGRTGVKNPNRPTGAFIFAGPTGVGKTELSRVLARVLFGGDQALIKLDMSEYMEKHSVSKMLGAPPGYVGHEDRGGKLTELVRRRPYSVVLFDEIEKAHPDVLNVLLQLMEDGFLTDSHGRRVDFKNTIVIMTTNAGAAELANKGVLGFEAGNRAENRKALVKDALKQQLRPEFINRVDSIVVFNRLRREDIAAIALKNLRELEQRLRESGYGVTFDESVAAWIARDGYDEKYGARPVRRLIQNRVEDFVADQILHKALTKRQESVLFVEDGKLAVQQPAHV